MATFGDQQDGGNWEGLKEILGTDKVLHYNSLHFIVFLLLFNQNFKKYIYTMLH